MADYSFSVMYGVGQTAGGVLLPRVLEQALIPIDTYISSIKGVSQYVSNLQAWRANPAILPPPDALMELTLRGMLDDTPGGGQLLALNALRQQGIDNFPPSGQYILTDARRRLWNAVEALKYRLPDAMWLLDAYRKGLLPDGWDIGEKLRRVGCLPEWFLAMQPSLLTRPGPGEIITMFVRDRITFEDATQLFKESGTDVSLWSRMIRAARTVPDPTTLIVATNRGLITPEQFRQELHHQGYLEGEFDDMWDQLRKTLPGEVDLLRMINRRLFTPQLAGRYGLYDEFEEAARPWFTKLGLDYPIGLQIVADGAPQEASLPKMLWGATREILPLVSAYQAYWRFRDDQIDRYKGEFPGITPFTKDDLVFHLRVAGYPPPMRDYLAALSHPPLPRRSIQYAVRFLGKDRAWVGNRFMDLGLSVDNAFVEADIAIAREQYRVNGWRESLAIRTGAATAKEIEGMYDDGIIDRPQALSQFSALGMSADLSQQLLDLSDARRARGLLRAAVSATGRDYLSGALSAGETLQSLAQLGIKSQRAGELMQIWTIRRSRHRRIASTGQIVGWRAKGRITAEDARRRLNNLQWSDPDKILLLADAQAKLDELVAKEKQAEQKDEAARAKEIQRLAKEAEAERKRLVAEANRVAPRGVLTQWLRDKVIDESTYRDMMSQRGYPEEEINRYVQDANTPRPPRPKVLPPPPPWPRRADSAHPSVAMAEKWYLTEIIDETGFSTILEDLGYGPSDRSRIIAAAALKHGAKGTTREPPAPPPPA